MHGARLLRGKSWDGPDLIRYEVNSPLWTDGAFKPRYMVVPSDEQIVIGAALLSDWIAQMAACP